ncbi:MAG: baseplate J/gp47 family protein [Neisseriaceae bacterium]
MKTQQQYYQQYVKFVKALNPIALPDAVATDWWVKANVIGGIASGIDQDIYSFRQNIFPQYASGNALDKFLASYNLAPRSAGVPATGYCSLVSKQTQDITIPANTKLSISNNHYFVQQTTIIRAGELGQIPIQCTNTGSGQQLANGTELKLAIPIANIDKLVVLGMNDGAGSETDANVRYRIIQAIQNPKLGGTKQDYITWATSQPNITDAYVIANILQTGILSIFVLSGTNDPDVILANSDISYNRTTTKTDIKSTQDYIETQRPINDNALVSSTDTQIYVEANTINIGVILLPNLTLDTVLASFNNITVADLIRREVRRAFITSPLYGTQIGNGRYILLSDIVQSIDSGLSVTNGIYAQILIDRKVDYKATQDNIPINTEVQQDNNLFLVYDITYAAINVYVMQN